MFTIATFKYIYFYIDLIFFFEFLRDIKPIGIRKIYGVGPVDNT